MNDIAAVAAPSASSPLISRLVKATDVAPSDGTQAIRRAVAMLRLVATYGHPGVTLAEVSHAMRLSRSTAHRILKCLVDEGLLDLDGTGYRYTIGQLAFELSLSGLKDHHSSAAWSELPIRVARVTGQTGYLMARTGGEAVCLQKAEGHAVLRVTPVEVGQRRPLGVGAGGIALLASFDEDEIEHFANSIGEALRPFRNITPERMLEEALEAKKRGFAVSNGLVFEEVVGIGIALPAHGRPRLAVSITAPRRYFEGRSIDSVASAMQLEIAEMVVDHIQ